MHSSIGHCTYHHLIPTYTNLGAWGTADHLPLLRLFFPPLFLVSGTRKPGLQVSPRGYPQWPEKVRKVPLRSLIRHSLWVLLVHKCPRSGVAKLRNHAQIYRKW